MSKLYEFEVTKPNGELVSLKQFAGKVILIVNTASKCGFTPQFEGLQALYKKYEEQGLVVLGFPSDQFNNQEFDDIDETMSFCQINFGVTFPMFSKIDVNGPDAHPLYNYLTEQKRGILTRKIEWNFAKFLIDREGQIVKRFASTTSPDSIEKDIVKLL